MQMNFCAADSRLPAIIRTGLFFARNQETAAASRSVRIRILIGRTPQPERQSPSMGICTQHSNLNTGTYCWQEAITFSPVCRSFFPYPVCNAWQFPGSVQGVYSEYWQPGKCNLLSVFRKRTNIRFRRPGFLCACSTIMASAFCESGIVRSYGVIRTESK